MAAIMKVNTYVAKSMEKVSSNGLTAPSTKENGVITRCMVKESSDGVMVGYIKVTTIMIRNTETVFTPGQTEECIKEDSTMESNMERVFTNKLMELKFMASGRKERRVSYARIDRSSSFSKTTSDAALTIYLFYIIYFKGIVNISEINTPILKELTSTDFQALVSNKV